MTVLLQPKPPLVSREGQTLRGGSLVVRYANLVKLPHTVFALPFALLGVLAAARIAPVAWTDVAWVVVAFTSARFVAMGVNRIADREVDARNPRTRARELPSGRLSVEQAWGAVVVAAVVFFAAAWALNPLALALAPLALLWITIYSYTKRWTHWSHLWLGFALAIAPAGGYIAIAGRWSDPTHALLVIAAGVTAWVGGFDIFYALQDVDFDREHGLKSAAVRFGEARSILLAKLLHGSAIVGFAWYGVLVGFGAAYYVGVALAALVIAWEHRLVHPTDLSRLDRAFFTMNGLVSIIVFLGALIDQVLA